MVGKGVLYLIGNSGPNVTSAAIALFIFIYILTLVFTSVHVQVRQYSTQCCTVLLGCFYLLYMLYSNYLACFVDSLSSLVCNCCWLTVGIVVVVCVLLSYVYLLYSV
jgi:hypothetical protein